ncbi:DUF4030 domain-containing protein [Fictibacillus sp. 5RED26]|uniref:DUF4030 domain-containing protein n=1 Tax=unclassified Fictibacillus TaxID=2644029 RepID=UPI0018CFADAD|nr:MULTISPECIES: DUF4030 domain-containing protein [unclassified Fictibacillus]MBH0158601.1 DUF4030 domain-containing protein [Fictibacillus sp. 5RED26]MBH0175740.1 DUF4030 domain-containing protein [Fictibacillus sp. 23RED33]
MEDKLKKLRGSMKASILNDITFDETLEQKIHDRLKKRTIKKKNQFLYTMSAAVLLFALFIGSAFVSPAMAKVASKLPYLGQFFETKDIVMVMHEDFVDKGYKVASVGVSYQGKKEVLIVIDGSSSYFDKVKGGVESTASELLKSRDYDAYSVVVSKYENDKDETTPEQEERFKKESELFTALDGVYKKYQLTGLSLNSVKKVVEVEIPDTNTKMSEIEQQVQSVIRTKTNKIYTVKFKKVNMKKRDQDRRWAEILGLVGDELMGKKVYKVTGLGYSVYPSPEIIFKTSLKESVPEAENHAKELEKVIEEFLKTEKMQAKVKGDSYKITIRSEDYKKIN